MLVKFLSIWGFLQNSSYVPQCTDRRRKGTSICTCTQMSAFASRFDSTGRTCSTDFVLREDDADGATTRQENTSVQAAQPSQFTASVTEKVLCSEEKKKRLAVVWRGFPCKITQCWWWGREKNAGACYLRTWCSDYGAPDRLCWLHNHRTSNYHDMDLVMINDEWDKLYSTSAPLLSIQPCWYVLS